MQAVKIFNKSLLRKQRNWTRVGERMVRSGGAADSDAWQCMRSALMGARAGRVHRADASGARNCVAEENGPPDGCEAARGD